ncbi:hypothetical protein V8C86DRAFT_3026658 [Haematococcus lacustris]
MAAHGGAVAPEHLVDDAPSEAASWTQRVKKKTHNVADLLNKLKASKAVRKDYRAMVDLKLKKVIIACVLCWTTPGKCITMTHRGLRQLPGVVVQVFEDAYPAGPSVVTGDTRCDPGVRCDERCDSGWQLGKEPQDT